MLSANKLKFIKSLRLKKHRQEHQLFLAEGTHLVADLCRGFCCETLVVTDEWLQNHTPSPSNELIVTNVDTFHKLSLQKEPQGVLGVFRMKTNRRPELPGSNLQLALDNIQDPGNFGTIIRIADWFGINDIFCSNSTVDMYNPKVVQSCMGALSRVNVHYVDLPEFLASLIDVPIYGATLDGENVFTKAISRKGIVVMGNEGQGISTETYKNVTHRVLIPRFGDSESTTESLNVAVATAIICAEFRRQLTAY